jgi:phage terminase large subunit-like protein
MGLRGPGAKPVKARKRRASPRKSTLTRAETLCRFIEGLKITAGMHAGRKFKLRPWQREIIAALYAVGDDGHRLKRSALITLPRKSGKTALAAALALAHLLGPEAEQRGQIVSAAADRAQAALLYNEMLAMIRANQALADRVIIRDFNKTITDSETGSVYTALSADARKAHGLSPSFAVLDELAQWPSRDLYDALVSGGGARLEPMFVTISTKSPDENSVMSELVRYAEQVLDGTIEDESFHGTIFAAGPDDDPFDREVWHRVNPALGDFRSLKEFEVAAEQAERVPGRRPAFELLYLNRAIDAEASFLARGDWLACAADIDVESLRGERCFLGLDLSSTTDLTGLAAWFPESGNLLAWCWLPAEGLAEAERRDHAPYTQWQREGHLLTTPGRSIDRAHIVHQLGELVADFRVEAMFADRWRLDEIERLLGDEGMDRKLKVVPHGQGWADMGPSLDAFEAVVLAKQLRHPNHPVMTACVANATVLTDPAGNRKLTKSNSYGRIDLLVAAVMAVGGAARVPAKRESVYKTRGLLTLPGNP